VEALREKNADIINGQKQLTGEATQRGKKHPWNMVIQLDSTKKNGDSYGI
jgi:hypothetical protein